MTRWFLLALLLRLAVVTPVPAAAQTMVRAEPVLAVDRLIPGASFRLAVVLELTAPWHINAHPASLPDLIPTTLTFAASPLVGIARIDYPPGARVAVGWADKPVALYTGRAIIFAAGTVRAGAPPGPLTITAHLEYQACNDQVCVAPKIIPLTFTTRIAAPTETPQALHPDIFPPANAAPNSQSSAFRRSGPAVAPATATPGNSIAATIQQRGLALTLLGIFLAGLALNLTPCVFPMIAITVSYFGGRTERHFATALARALTYFFGIVITYSLLGLVAALTGSLFGALLQNPVVLVGIALLLAGMALSMFGLFELQPPQFLMQQAAGLSARAGYVGLFFLGAVVGIIAAPCVAPVQVSLLAFVSQTANPWLGWWMFFSLSVGLGLPYVVLGTFPGLLARLPRSGTWMVWVKRVFGVVLLGIAAWFVKPLLIRATAPVRSPIDWHPYAPDLVAHADKPVLIDFAADWCLPCHEMDRKTFADPRVIAASKHFLMLRADLTRTSSSAVQKLTAQFNIVGVPTTVFIARSGQERADLRQIGFVPADTFLRVMDQALAAAPTNAPPATAAPGSAADIPPQLLQPF